MDSESNPIESATVTIGSDSETTDEDGKAEFELAYGDYEASVSATGYVTATESLAFRSNHKNFTVTLESATGTVTVTATNPVLYLLEVVLYTGEMPAPQDDSNLVAYGYVNNDNSVALTLYDTTTHQSTEDTAIPFGTYNIYADGRVEEESELLTYNGTLTVDGDEEITLTLTEQ